MVATGVGSSSFMIAWRASPSDLSSWRSRHSSTSGYRSEIGSPHQAFASSFCYAGKEHPELAEQGGRVIYVTYVDNQRYWLQLLKVTLAKERPR